MKKPSHLLPPLALLALVSGALAVGPGESSPEVEIVSVEGPVHYLVGRGGNVGLSIGADGVLMIDSQFATSASDIEAAIATLAEDAPRFLLNTHWHPDHIGGNPHFGQGALVLAHRNVRGRMTGDESLKGNRMELTPPAQALPTITFERGLSLYFNGEELKLVHFPAAHTDGDTIVWFTGTGVAHLGDLYFSGRFPYIDARSGGSVRGVVAALDAILELLPAGTRVIAGHGEDTELEELRASRDMIAEVLARVERARSEDVGLAELLELGLIDDLAERWEPEGSFVTRDTFLTIIWDELERE